MFVLWFKAGHEGTEPTGPDGVSFGLEKKKNLIY